MKNKANVLFIILIFFTTSLNLFAGILENIENELTSLVKKAEPYLVTVESENLIRSKVFVGSGVLMEKAGYILTTSSFISENDNITVTFKDNESFSADLVGIDYLSGLALLKIDPVDRQVPELGSAFNLRKGSWITIIGNSYDVPGALNFGFYSGITDEGLLQLSIQTGPGSAGGAVFNAKGEIIGLLIARVAETTSLFLPYENQYNLKVSKYSGMKNISKPIMNLDLPDASTSLAVPIERITRVVEQLKKHGEVKYGYLGIQQKSLTRKDRQKYYIDGGVVVVKTAKNSPAGKAGLLKGDIIIKFDNYNVRNPSHLFTLVRTHMPDDKIMLEVIRDGSPVRLTVSLGEAPDENYQDYWYNSGTFSNGDIWAKDYQKFLQDNSDSLKTYLDNLKKYQKKLSDNEDNELNDLENRIDKLEQHLDELSSKLLELNGKLNTR